jgi:hypothetical protein
MDWAFIIGEIVGGAVGALWLWCRWAIRSQQLKYRHELDYLTMKEYTEKSKELVSVQNKTKQFIPMSRMEVMTYVLTGRYPGDSK